MSREEGELLDVSMNEDNDGPDGVGGGGDATAAAIAAATMNVSGDSTEDVLQTLQAKIVLRKNLEQEFHTVSEKIAHFESESKKNVAAAAATLTASKPPPREHPNEALLHGVPTPSVGLAPTPSPRFQVFLRVRPSTDDTNTIRIVNSTTVQTHPPATSYAGLTKEYTYDAVLAPSLSQLQVYERTAAPLVERFLRGGSVLLFCYGVTNAGKTFTVHGEGSRVSGSTTTGTAHAPSGSVAAPEASWGLLPRILYDTYHRVASDPSKELHLTFFELYQERFYDLLSEDSTNANLHRRTALRLREDKVHGHAFVEGLTTHKIDSIPQALQRMKTAKKNRQTATNDLNQSSSRSHCVCQLFVSDSSSPDDDDTPPASFWVVDLAGSERHKRTASSGMMRHQEACSINKSLMTLMRCLMTLKESSHNGSNGGGGGGTGTNGQYNNKAMPPFRESKLTHLLMPHWSDFSHTVTAMIVNVNPAACDYEESQHVLSYATQAKTIQLPPLGTARGGGRSEARNGAEAAPKVEYDENGRRKRVGGGMRAKVGQLLQKLSPKRGAATGGVKRKADAKLAPPKAASLVSKRLKKGDPAPYSATSNAPPAAAARATFPANRSTLKPVPPSTAVKSSKAYKALQMELTVATAENTFLKADKRELEEQLENLEEQVRGEMAEEMEQQLNAMRHKYEAVIQALRQQKLTGSAAKAMTPGRRDLRAEDKIEELQDQVQECEEEMVRQREEHARELEATRHEYERMLSDALKEAAKERDQLRAELAQKKELIANYSRLLLDEEESDGAEEIEELEEEEGEEDTQEEESGSTEGNEAEIVEDELECEENDGDLKATERKSGFEGAPDSPTDDSIDDVSSRSSDESTGGGKGSSVRNDAAATRDSVCSSNSAKSSNGIVKKKDDDAVKAPSDLDTSLPTTGHQRASATFVCNDPPHQECEARDVSSDSPVQGFVDENLSPATTMGCNSTSGDDENVSKLRVSPKLASNRKPLASSINQEIPSSVPFDDDLEMRFKAPKKKVKKDPKTGLFQRPKGRQPSGVEAWDAKRGQWRLSNAFVG